MSIHLVWFRNDLRTTDHHPLVAAIEAAKNDGGGVLPIYIVDPHWFARTRLGFQRAGPQRIQFLCESIIDLQTQIESLGSRLAILRGSTADVLKSLFESLPISSIHFCEELPPEEKAIELAVTQLAASHPIEMNLHPPGTLLKMGELPFEIDQTPELFTKFRRIVEKQCDEPPPLARPDSIPSIATDHWNVIEDVPIHSIAMLQADLVERDDRAVIGFVGGETSGLKRLSDYLWETEAIKTYKETRNGMLSRDDSSKFSNWLAHGCLSARQIAAEVRRYETQRVANDSTYWMIFELLWRDYFALMMAKHGAALFQQSGLRGEDQTWNSNEIFFEAWCNGQTGFPLIDANMRELKQTGYMSNRGRQNVGSFLTKNLGVDWRYGAEWFESLLIDYDPSSNYGNWNYVAGVGNDARGFRWFNTLKQSENYDPMGDYVRHWCPELARVPTRWIHQPWKMDHQAQAQCGCIIGDHYPAPIVDLFKSADRHRELYEQAIKE